ncbi:MAG: hypothetical protein K6U04_15910 [Armatimonadetes bacterium]|nr:hypothetical protein [Armatimonadota bacterium]
MRELLKPTEKLSLTPQEIMAATGIGKIELGEDLKLVSERLGHTSISITADIYGHLSEGRQKEAARKIDTLLADALT